jgi:hypothetical protein
MSTDPLNNPAALEHLLMQLGVSDTATIQAAEAALKPVLKKAACLPALLMQLQGSQNMQVRQMAAILIKKK